MMGAALGVGLAAGAGLGAAATGLAEDGLDVVAPLAGAGALGADGLAVADGLDWADLAATGFVATFPAWSFFKNALAVSSLPAVVADLALRAEFGTPAAVLLALEPRFGFAF